MMSQALSTTAGQLLKDSPSVVVRRVSPLGWSALPAEESIRLAKSVPGVLQAGIRIWGTANGPGGPVTVFGFDGSHRFSGLTKSVPLPKRGEAVLGAGITTGKDPDFLKLTGHNTLIFRISDTLEAKTSMVAHDMVLVHPDDAGQLLGIAEGYASDLIVEVFHETEAEAILPDLSRAFPWPVRLTTRNEAVGIYTSASARRSGIVYITIIPGMLALALIVVGVVKGQMVKSCNVGLFKALGWTTTNIFQMQLLKALVIGIPAVTAGMVVSYSLVFRSGSSWPGYMFFGWNDNPPPLFLNASGAFLVLIEVTVLVFLPYLAAALWPALRAAVSDPQDFLES
jgi:ABC-type lipoprotein release transport system permease subunit